MAVLIAMLRPRVIELGFLQLHRLADQPAAQAVPDHQNAFPQVVVWILDVTLDSGHQAGIVCAHLQLHGHHGFEQAGELECPLIHLFQGLAIDHQRTHGGEGACARPARAQPHELIAGAVPDNLHQGAELIAAHPCLFNAQQIRRDAGLLQQLAHIQPQPLCARQRCFNKVL